MRVVLIDTNEDAAVAAAAGIGTIAEAVRGDVADNDAMVATMGEIATRHGGIDVLINNAGIHSAEAMRFIGDLGVEKTRRMFDVNVMGVIHCSLAARPFMKYRAGASIINISSMAAFGSDKAYGVSKLAVRGLTISFAHEFADDGIRVNAIAPGLIFTDTIRAELPDAVLEQVVATQIIPRGGEERDIVETMMFLTSPRAAFITGETLKVSGGAMLHI